jgi:hypothetical protein
MCCQSNDESRDQRFQNFSSRAELADVSFFDLIAAPKRDAPCGSAKARVLLVFP